MGKLIRNVKKIYIAPQIRKLNDRKNDKKLNLRKSRAGGPPSIPGPASTSPSTPGATVF